MVIQMKDSGIEWIGDIPAHWQVIPHKYIMHKEKSICESYNGEDIISLTMNGVIVRDLTAGGKMPTTFDGYQYVEPEDLLMCLFDIDVTPRCVGVVRNYGVTSPAYSCFKVHEGYHNAYYDYLLRFIDDEKVFVHLAKNLRSSLTETDFGAIKTVAPPLEEQLKIVEFLDRQCAEIDAVIIKTKTTIEEYKKYRSAIIDEAIKNEICPKYKFRYLGELKNGLNYHNTSETRKIKFLGVGDFKDYMILSGSECFSDLPIDEDISEEYLLKDGDIIFVRSNGSKDLVGRSVMVNDIDFELTYSGFCIRFRNQRNDLVENKYLLYFFRSEFFKELLKLGSVGANINNLSQDILNAVRVPIPTKIRQNEIINFLDKKCADIDALIEKKTALLEEMEYYKKSVIYECVTGKKEII